MSAADRLPHQDPESDSLGDRTLDRWMGVDQIRLGPAPLSKIDTGRGQWNGATHRFRSPWERLRRRVASALSGSRSLYDDPRNTWKERLIDLFAYAVMAAILAAFAYVVYRGLQLAGWL